MAGEYENDDVACYFTTKHSWRGKYKRVFSIGSKAITTYNPANFEVTNQWAYKDFLNIMPSLKAPNEVTIVVRKAKEGKKTQNMTFSTEHREDLITEALKFYKEFAGYKSGNELRFGGYKLHWSERKVPVTLEVSPGSLDQIDPRDNKKLCSYSYKDIELIALVSDYPGGFVVVYGGFSRMHLFTTDRREELLKKMMEASFNNVGVTIKQKKSAIKVESFLKYKFGKYSDDEHITSMSEFSVYKQSHRSKDPVQRTLCFSEICLLERDPATYNIVTLHPLSSIFSIIRYRDHPQLFGLEYTSGQLRRYSSPDRDTLLAGLLDGVRASGNRDVCVKTTPTKRGYRWGPLYCVVEEEVESSHLKFLASPPGKFTDAVYRFNCNISYSGLLHAVTQDGFFTENKERLIVNAITMLIAHEGDQNKISEKDLEAQFHALRRLVASKAGFRAFTTLPGFREKVGVKTVKALKRKNEAVTHAAVDMLCTLMQPMHDNYDIRQEQLNKSSLLSSDKFLESLLEILTTNVNRATGALVISGLLDFLTFALCPPYSETTDDEQFGKLLEKVAAMGRCIYRLFQHPSTTIVKGAGMVLKAIIEEGDEETAAKMQDLALAEGALPRHLHMAMFTQSTDRRLLMNRQLSRHLVGLWTTGHPTAMALLKRILPAGLLYYLESADQPPETEEDRLSIRDNVKLAESSGKARGTLRNQLEGYLSHWRTKIGFKSKKDNSQKPVVLRNRKQNIKSEQNWELFYYKFNQDLVAYNLIWNYKTREELRGALESEMRAFAMDKDLSGNYVVSWNHLEFEVLYECLSDELKIGDYYLRVLLEQNEEETPITNALEFFNDLYHRFLLTTKSSMKAMCLQAMTKVYGKCHEEIGAFNDTKYIVGMLDRTSDKLERDRLLFFLNELTKHQRNVKALLDVNAIKGLVELMTLCHLHTSRATVPLQTNLLEAAPDTGFGGEKEWYYGNKEKERLGPFSFDEMKEFWQEEVLNPSTRCWCQGMDGWRPLQHIPQLKWFLLASGTPLMNETDMAVLILNMLIRICSYYPNRDVDGAIVRPLPRAKRMLSEATCLPHIVQLLLTFDPIIVEKVSVLLNDILLDNPVIPRLYLTGVFYFIMMYTGSNLLPIGKFLSETHMKQSFRSEQNQGGEISQRSILGALLPEAMICYLENHGCDKFSSIFLGEFDTPEAIWSSEMRRFMIGKIASHLADFSPRLRSNTKALYQYCPIPAISYPQLEHELFCNIYYLRHLCDTQRFPEWPIKEPVKFLKDLLEAWKAEVEKKPPDLSVEQALKILNLKKKPEEYDEAKIRKAYFRMAQKYHPDKNPEGRDIFEQVSKAYDFLCSRSSRKVLGPDPRNIILILRAQSILFSRCKEVLEPYKYSGYPMLIKTIQMEIEDSKAFSKETALLPSACELCYHTVNTSALNAEELRRENGIEILQTALSRAIDLVGSSSKPGDVPVQVCCHIVHCYAVASQFEKCREKIAEMQIIVQELCRLLYYKNLPGMCILSSECVSSFSVDFWLQTHLLQAGVLWHLVLFMFNYDYTLEEGGVESSSETNQQEIANELARKSVRAVARLGGYLEGDEKTPENPAIKKSLDAMLTPYLARKLHNSTPQELLKLLNSNTENPNLIWDNATRGEIMKFLGEEQERKITTGECDPSFGADFVYSVYEKELIIGEIFVRVYNDQPSYPLENPKKFAADLLNFIGNQAQYLHSLLQLQASSGEATESETQQQRFEHVTMALEALRNVIKASPGVEEKCVGQFKLIFSLLRMSEAIKLQQLALEVISNVTGNKNCVSDIADSNVISYLLLTLYTLSTCRPLVTETLHALCSNTKIVKEAHSKGALVYLLDLFCNSSNPSVRAKAAELFNKMMADKLVGPKVKITLTKFLPTIFMDAMRENPEVSVHMFEGMHENPELVWNDESREKVCDAVKKERNNFYEKQKDDPEASWKLPEDFEVVYSNLEGELVVGGVYLNLFIAQPHWVLRKPKEFLLDLMDKYAALLRSSSPDGQLLETFTQAVVAIFTVQPGLADQMPSLGHLPAIFKSMKSTNDAIPRSAIQVIHILSNNEFCVRSLSEVDVIRPMIAAMDARPDIIVLACEALHQIFDKNQSALVEQAVKAELVQYLLKLLDTDLKAAYKIENAAASKAQIVKALKAMSRDFLHGEKVLEILDKSEVWTSYKDQKHDLFISDRNVAGYLTGPMGVAGYLTQGAANSSAMPNKPPPIESILEDETNE